MYFAACGVTYKARSRGAPSSIGLVLKWLLQHRAASRALHIYWGASWGFGARVVFVQRSCGAKPEHELILMQVLMGPMAQEPLLW